MRLRGRSLVAGIALLGAALGVTASSAAQAARPVAGPHRFCQVTERPSAVAVQTVLIRPGVAGRHVRTT